MKLKPETCHMKKIRFSEIFTDSSIRISQSEIKVTAVEHAPIEQHNNTSSPGVAAFVETPLIMKLMDC
jgi:hypothetical protein